MVSLRKHRNVPEFKTTTSSTIENSLGCAKSGIAINKCASKKDKVTGDSGKKKSTSAKIKLQLFPLDDVAFRYLELEKHNPYLELMIGTQKKISSVLKHLNQKWGKPKTTSGELMLFPGDVQLNSLRSCKRWTINDSDVTATDVYIAIGSPAIFRLRYGWFSNIEIRASDPTLVGLEFKKHPWSKKNERGMLTDIEQRQNPPIPTANTKHVPATTDASVNQNACNELDDTYNKDNKQRIANNSDMQLDLSNISFGAFLSEMSRNASMRQHTCDSFDAAIAQFKSSVSADPVLRTSILDAEDTRTPFCIKKTTSDEIVSAETQDIHSGPLNSLGEKMFSQIDLQASPHNEGSLIKKLDLNMMEFGHLENDQPSSKQLNNGDNICFNGLIGNGQISYASQNFSLSNMDS